MPPKIIHDLKVPLDEELAERLAWMVPEHGPYRILRQSVDARQRHSPHFVYSIEIADKDEILSVEQFHLETVKVKPTQERPVIVGSGPAGLFAALRLVERGIPCLLLERGSESAARIKASPNSGGMASSIAGIMFVMAKAERASIRMANSSPASKALISPM